MDDERFVSPQDSTHTVQKLDQYETDYFFASFQDAREFVASQLDEAYDADRLTPFSMKLLEDIGVWEVSVTAEDGTVWRIITTEAPA